MLSVESPFVWLSNGQRCHLFEPKTNRNKVMKKKVKDNIGIQRSGKNIHLLVPKTYFQVARAIAAGSTLEDPYLVTYIHFFFDGPASTCSAVVAGVRARAASRMDGSTPRGTRLDWTSSKNIFVLFFGLRLQLQFFDRLVLNHVEKRRNPQCKDDLPRHRKIISTPITNYSF